MKFFKACFAASCLLMSAMAWGQGISYDLATGILTIPSVSVGGTMYVNVTLQNVGPGYTFALKTATPQSPLGPTVSAYDLASGVLTMTSVGVGSTSYDVTMRNIGNYTFVLQTASVARQWAWMSGSKTIEQAGVYGTLGAAAPGNVPGARDYSISWIDAAGNLWLFGGEGRDSNGSLVYLNDLWRYNPTTNLWTWVSGPNKGFSGGGVYGTLGVAAPGNVPGQRKYSLSWIDTLGNLWLFGGQGYDSRNVIGNLNDLWKFSPATGQWTWMSGSSFTDQVGVYGTQGTAAPANTPSALLIPVCWTDAAGNFWLFGGQGINSKGSPGILNDLWKYSPSTGLWTWISGTSGTNGSSSGLAQYGTQGVAAVGNIPGGRQEAVTWTDSSGNLWLFGGSGLDANGGATGLLNDLWKYSPTSAMWTWVSGSNKKNAFGVYGTRGLAAPGNVPGSRQFSTSWADSSGSLWLFGGAGYDARNISGNLFDLWKFTPATGMWTWVSGSSTANGKGVYGTQGVSSWANLPGGRYGSISWTDSAGKLWLFGGWGDDAVGSGGHMNDLWEY
jgi:N-acetylneuraminic acid mutarotase